MKETWVIKIGSSLITKSSTGLNIKNIKKFASDPKGGGGLGRPDHRRLRGLSHALGRRGRLSPRLRMGSDEGGREAQPLDHAVRPSLVVGGLAGLRGQHPVHERQRHGRLHRRIGAGTTLITMHD